MTITANLVKDTSDRKNTPLTRRNLERREEEGRGEERTGDEEEARQPPTNAVRPDCQWVLELYSGKQEGS